MGVTNDRPGRSDTISQKPLSTEKVAHGDHTPNDSSLEHSSTKLNPRISPYSSQPRYPASKTNSRRSTGIYSSYHTSPLVDHQEVQSGQRDNRFLKLVHQCETIISDLNSIKSIYSHSVNSLDLCVENLKIILLTLIETAQNFDKALTEDYFKCNTEHLEALIETAQNIDKALTEDYFKCNTEHLEAEKRAIKACLVRDKSTHVWNCDEKKKLVAQCETKGLEEKKPSYEGGQVPQKLEESVNCQTPKQAEGMKSTYNKDDVEYEVSSLRKLCECHSQ